MDDIPSPQPAFAVAADTSWATDRPNTLKSDDLFAIFGRFGDMEADAEGLYHRDTRHLSKLAITLDGGRPRMLSASVSMDNATLVCDLACPAPWPNLDMGDHGNEILLRRETFLWRDTRHDLLAVTNWSSRQQRVALSIIFAADFADLFEIRGTARAAHGTMQAPECGDEDVTLGCLGLDGVLRRTRLSFVPRPKAVTGSRADYDLALAPGETRRLTIAITCGTALDPAAAFLPARHAARRHRQRLRHGVATLATGNPIADGALRRSRDDLIMLTTATAQGPYPYAGVPWFSTAFGRDAIITALEVLWVAPALARGVLGYLAATQATAVDVASDAEPGKILHEARDGEMARRGEVPFRRYYGSVDATPLFVMLAGAYLDRTGDVEFVRGIWPNITAALGWIDRFGDADGDGFVEYGRKSKDGLVNQGWKDSRDSIFHEDGALAEGPIALCEVQGYVFAAKQAAARVAAALGLDARAVALDAEAHALRERFDDAFWDAEMGFYVLALDGAKRPCRVLASNAGHALFAGIALPERAGPVAARLMAPAFFSGWGIRTVAQGQPRYNPMSYHNGSVWPHDNALIGMGLARYGRRADAARLFDLLLAASGWEERSRLPELFCGLTRGVGKAPTAYPVACAPQAWAAGALPALLDACLGLTFDPARAAVTLTAPVLPSGLERLLLTNLAVGDQRVTVSVSRNTDGSVAAAG